MNFPRPSIIRLDTLTEAIDLGCDTVMPRVDGWPIVINCLSDRVQVFSDMMFNHTREWLYDLVTTEPLTGLFIGAKPRGDAQTPIVLYDAWWVNGFNMTKLTFRERYALTRTNVTKFDERFSIVTVYPITQAASLWSMTKTYGWKGLVFRRSKDTAAGELYVLPYYKEAPETIRYDWTPNERVLIHQYLYYVKSWTLWQDVEYDEFCKKHSVSGIAGSDLAEDYPEHIRGAAERLYTRQHK